MSGKTRINIPRKLFHINMFSKGAIEESILDIKLPKRPFICDNKRKHNTDSSSFDNWTESVSVVETRYLGVTFSNKASLETLDGSIRKIFSEKHPFRAHDVGVDRARNQNSSTIFL